MNGWKFVMQHYGISEIEAMEGIGREYIVDCQRYHPCHHKTKLSVQVNILPRHQVGHQACRQVAMTPLIGGVGHAVGRI
jgi:hypothetical protein